MLISRLLTELLRASYIGTLARFSVKSIVTTLTELKRRTSSRRTNVVQTHVHNTAYLASHYTATWNMAVDLKR